MEQRRRTLLKTFSWRLVAYIVSTLIVYLFNHDIKESAIMIGVADFLKLFIYYVHERAWNRVRFGRIKDPEYQI